MTTCHSCGATLRPGLPACPRCALKPSRDESFGGLLIEEELGRGGMGVVYRARDQQLGRTVAVKFLAPELAHDPEVKARFEREAKVLAALNHPNIVTLYAFDQEEGEAFLVMEYVEGSSVASDVPQPAVDAVKVAIEVCKALSHAHALGVIHRDLKPANVLRTSTGSVKVTDFGIARLVDSSGRSSGITDSNLVSGTTGFIAPEALTGAAPDARMDIYGVGALTRALVTGRPPVGELGDVPDALAPVIRRAMAEKPKDRFQTMDELQRALLSVLPWLDDVALPPDERLWVRAVALLGTASVGVGLWALVRSLSPRVLSEGEELPLSMLGSEVLPDGRILSRARFETFPILGSLVALALGMLAYGALRRHWRVERLDLPSPAQPIPESATVFGIGVIACLLFGARKALELTGHLDMASGSARSFVPLFGGVLEVLALYYFLVALLESRRRARPLQDEKLLLFGMSLSLIPPATDLITTLLSAAGR